MSSGCFHSYVQQVYCLKDSPLFKVIPSHLGLVPLTGLVARKNLKNISIVLSLNKPLTFYDFRRAGLLGVPTWCSFAGHPSTRHMVFTMCVEICKPSYCSGLQSCCHLSSSSCLLVLLLNWVFGCFFCLYRHIYDL